MKDDERINTRDKGLYQRLPLIQVLLVRGEKISAVFIFYNCSTGKYQILRPPASRFSLSRLNNRNKLVGLLFLSDGETRLNI